jgi:hypothetical protein
MLVNRVIDAVRAMGLLVRAVGFYFVLAGLNSAALGIYLDAKVPPPAGGIDFFPALVSTFIGLLAIVFADLLSKLMLGSAKFDNITVEEE